MDLVELYPLLRSLWTVWFFALFVGIVAWTLWPKRKTQLEEHAQIPLRDDR
jgi:cbb3-type cytochrome oxidase subunit 3